MTCLRVFGSMVLVAVLSGCGGGDGGSTNGNSGGSGAQTYSVGGTLSGAQYANVESGPQLVLFDNGGNAIEHPPNGAFTFSQKLAAGATYDVTAQVSLLYPAQTCTVTHGNGTAGPSSATAVTVTCTTSSFTLSGSVSGLTGGGLVLSDGSESLPVSGNGAFTFTKPLLSGTDYMITVATQPSSPSQTCSATTENSRGQIATTNVTGIQIACRPNSYSVGGSVSGLTGTGLSLTVSAIDTVSAYPYATTPFTASVAVTANGSFTMPGFLMATGDQYAVSAATMPTGQTCLVPDGAATVTNASVTVTVVCAAPRFAYAAGAHGNDVLGYAVDFATGALTALPGSPFASGDTTNAVALDSTHHFLFAANTGSTGGAGSNTISVYSIDAGTGALTPVAGSPFAATTAPTALAIAPSGRYLYVSDYHDNTVTAFAISATGSLTPTAGGPTVTGVDGPRALTILPDGKALYLSVSNENAIYSYAIDVTSGALTALPGSPLTAAGGPGAVQLLPGATLSATGAYAVWAYTAPVTRLGIGTLAWTNYTLDPVTGTLGGEDTVVNQGVSNLGASAIGDFGVADPEGRIFYLVGRETAAATDAVMPICYASSCRTDWETSFPTNTRVTSATVDPSGRFLYLTDTAGNALPFVIDRIGAKLTAGTSTAGAFRPYTSVVFTTQ